MWCSSSWLISAHLESTTLELAHGHAPFSKYPPMKVPLMTIQNAPPGLDYDRDKKFSKASHQTGSIFYLFVSTTAFPHSICLFLLRYKLSLGHQVRSIFYLFSFKEMVAMCLVKDLTKRPTAEKLLKHSFFKNAKPPELSVQKLSADLPPLWNHVKANLSLKDAAQLALKKMPSAKQEALSHV
ncbi:unnamed protein product [Coffea canephora]|uniref:DH200=94 genomic scaffold, scaffold_67 n=1 Tax=Coffea canephora TaxID=49390 RepID=A0A068UVD9_COFCA|nr:unnamed protein product [Coffea canephora]